MHKQLETVQQSIVNFTKSLNPDFVVVTGDICLSDRFMDHLVTDMLDSIGVPWTVALGNHDNEHSGSRSESLRRLEERTLHGMITESDDSDFLIKVNRAGSGNPWFNILALDTHVGGSDCRGEPTNGYGCVEDYQLDRAKGEVDDSVPTFLFQHIPPQEAEVSFNTDNQCSSTIKRESVCHCGVPSWGHITTALPNIYLAAFGHDHLNSGPVPAWTGQPSATAIHSWFVYGAKTNSLFGYSRSTGARVYEVVGQETDMLVHTWPFTRDVHGDVWSPGPNETLSRPAVCAHHTLVNTAVWPSYTSPGIGALNSDAVGLSYSIAIVSVIVLAVVVLLHVWCCKARSVKKFQSRLTQSSV
eukprot:gnl/Dysnectes_brevis/2411_a2861_1640.p1 GENE.gnl/Dysnectes_brevis/2411_a2861_1640~~gnl/Dysnectes_brevis/2411_a2861_1640.p1  ORF type:complete len:403 (+),score=33.63 gnl/Dysnectes_brevis/2411_a2861_1640:141-1211(+)